MNIDNQILNLNKHMTTFKVPDNFFKARIKSVILKKLPQEEVVTLTGITLLSDTKAENVQKPNVGRIYAVGSQVPEDLYPGLKVYYNHYADLTFMHEGVEYVMCNDLDIYAILPETSVGLNQIIPDRQVKRGKAIQKQVKRFETQYKVDQVRKDKQEQIVKKLIKKSPKKK